MERYLPSYRLARADIGAALNTSAGRGDRVVASFDEDSTTLGVAAARAALERSGREATAPAALYFATTTPAYADKANATAIHAALGLPETCLRRRYRGSARSAVAALRAAAATGGHGGSCGRDRGPSGLGRRVRRRRRCRGLRLRSRSTDAVAEIVGVASATDGDTRPVARPGSASGVQWEERFGLDRYAPLVERVTKQVLASAGTDRADHVAWCPATRRWPSAPRRSSRTRRP